MLKYKIPQIVTLTPKKDPKFAPDILRRNAIFCFTSNK